MTDYSELKRLVAQGSLPPIVATLIAENEALRAGLGEAKYRIEQGRVWNGQGWTMTGLNAHSQQQALTAIDSALSKGGG